MKVAIAIGHWITAPGAVNKTTGLSEFYFNTILASGIKLLKPDVKIFYRVDNNLEKLVEKINEYDPDIAIELHCNGASNEFATGSEVLYWYINQKTKILAEILSEEFSVTLGILCRGGKGVKKGDRGWFFLGKTKCPALICEPFFITNNEDIMRAIMNLGKLISVYVNFLRNYSEKYLNL